MIGPLHKLGYFGDEFGMIIAMLFGFLFGFFLEKSGFSSGKKLCDVWYGRDFAVIRVMFTAVITAMIGLWGLHYMGMVDMDLVYINPTYVWPQLTGAFILGAGFVIGGFCPGTSIVSSAVGRIDGMVFLGGFLLGIILFAETFPSVEGFYKSGSMGRVLLSDVTGLPPGVWVFIISAGGLAFFVLLKKIENMVNRK